VINSRPLTPPVRSNQYTYNW